MINALKVLGKVNMQHDCLHIHVQIYTAAIRLAKQIYIASFIALAAAF